MKLKINAWTLLLIFIILYFIFQIRQDVLRYNGLASENQKIDKSTREIMLTNRELEKRISGLNENRAIEGLARERLNFIRKGELAYKVCRLKSDRK